MHSLKVSIFTIQVDFYRHRYKPTMEWGIISIYFYLFLFGNRRFYALIKYLHVFSLLIARNSACRPVPETKYQCTCAGNVVEHTMSCI